MQQLPLDVRLIQPPSFDNFVAGPNQELVAMLRAIASGERPAKCLLIWGEPGSGKSHLIQALAQSGESAKAWPADASGQDQTDTSAGNQPTQSDLALLDDCQSLNETGQADWFARFIHQAGDRQAMIVASANLPPLHLPLRADLRTRLGSGLVFQLRRLNDDEKTEALRQHAASRQIPLPEDLTRHLLRHYPRDIRFLMTLLDRLDRFAFETRRAPSLPLLRDMEARQAQEPGPQSAD